MTHEEMLNEAVRLGDEGKFEDALSLWQALSNLPGLDLEMKCIFLLNQRRCYSALGQHERATNIIEELERLDAPRQFWVEIEHARIDDLRGQGKFAEAHKKLVRFRKKLVRFRKENAELLASPQYADLAYEGKLSIAYHLINQKRSAEGLEVLSQIMPILQDRDRREARYYLGFAHYQLREWDSALDEFRQLLDFGDDDAWSADAHYIIGLIYEQKGVLAWAKQHLQKAEILKSLLRVPIADVWMAMSNVYVRLGELEEAKRYRKLALSENCWPIFGPSEH